MDVVLVLITAPLTLAVAAWLAAMIRVRDGGPVIYRAPRVGQFGCPFYAFKFRTMSVVSQDTGVSGGDKITRILPFAHRIRRMRLDEIPQLINVLRGEMTLVGPRPPDPRYVNLYPELYAAVLRSRPGLTGLATLYLHRFEEKILREHTTPEATEQIYCRRCIPRKARLDLIYQTQTEGRSSLCFDISLLAKSLRAVLSR